MFVSFFGRSGTEDLECGDIKRGNSAIRLGEE
jgi:hypothetical protein